jgi:hypothetical protein
MPVVINEFEVVADAPSAARGRGVEATSDEKPHEVPEPAEIAPAIRSLQAKSLRAWAH